jgi:hypothetical protein
LSVGDEDHVQLVQWLVHKSHIVLFDGSMLGASICQLWEGCKKGLDS